MPRIPYDTGHPELVSMRGGGGGGGGGGLPYMYNFTCSLFDKNLDDMHDVSLLSIV